MRVLHRGVSGAECGSREGRQRPRGAGPEDAHRWLAILGVSQRGEPTVRMHPGGGVPGHYPGAGVRVKVSPRTWARVRVRPFSEMERLGVVRLGLRQGKKGWAARVSRSPARRPGSRQGQAACVQRSTCPQHLSLSGLGVPTRVGAHCPSLAPLQEGTGMSPPRTGSGVEPLPGNAGPGLRPAQ